MAIDKDAVAALDERRLGPEHKSLPPAAWGLSVREYLDTAPHLDDLATPVLTVDAAAMESNLAVMADWTRAAGVRLAPHGKTTMAPRLWERQLTAGAWGITLATGWQAQVARSFGVDRILLANALVDPVALQWVAAELAAHPEFEFLCWADSVATVELMDRVLESAPRTDRLTVLVELGGPHGRTGARSVQRGLEIAAAISASKRLRLGGVGGYEGALAHDRTDGALAAVHGYLDDLTRLHGEIAAAGMYPGAAVITAGGSAYPELVVEHLAGLADEDGARGVATTVVLRSGAYLIHDDGFYAGISPLAAGHTERPLRSAMHGWARTVSRPEPELALLDAGKRDLPFDEGLPVPQRIAGPAVRALPAGATVSALNDQHTFLRLPGAAPHEVPVGSVVRLGLSHPCTAFDKWRLIPVIDDADAERPRVVDLLHTFF
ncbi:D-threonine aldolase [Nocardia otitidiscaviarum]|uniref:D-threonine aldolase n=1 Tax=Nocardia otitidiscaviarum TaxID=1823 RepID=A0A379JJY7_9NOCA|nr:amino acid deaminase [Nocardia otitidiscaviarum]SUD48303.1 D-threonine aldolase [Nocardia otitidiscaviarum]